MLVMIAAVLLGMGAVAAPAVRPPLARGAAALWVSDEKGYIWQLSKDGTVLGAITDCLAPGGIKVDHAGNLWAACTNGSTVQEYAPGATSATLVLDDTPDFFPEDVAVDGRGIVFAANIDGFACKGSSCTTYPGDVVYWTKARQKNGALPSGTVHDPNMYEGFFLDTDFSGNLYVDMLSAASMAGETDEIREPLGRSPPIANLGIDLLYPGGVYVSNAGTVLNVLDQDTLRIGRYALPGASFIGWLGKLPQNFQKTCDPVSMGFSRDDASVAVADAGCHAVDLGDVRTKRYRQISEGAFEVPVGAAFTVSDK